MPAAKIKRPLLLLSNDDGYFSEGIKQLVRALRSVGEVVVVAPDRQQSASSHSLTLHRPLRIFKMKEMGNVYAVDGTPTDCITLGVHAVLKRRPDLIVSGINGGANLGDDVHYSGTVSAAMEGALLGIPSMAISLVTWGKGRCYYETAARFARRACRTLLKRSLAGGVVLNVNVPNLPPSRIRGAVVTRLGKRKYGEVLFKRTDPRGNRYYWIGGEENSFQRMAGSDCNAILEKKISVTPLQVDVTHHALLTEMIAWKF